MPRPTTEPIGLQLARTAKAASRGLDDALAAAGGSLPQWLILIALKREQHATQRDLAASVGVEGPTLTHHLNRMESDGLVTRTRDTANRRVQRVELTDAGEASFLHLLGTVSAFDKQLRAGFTATEIAALGDVLHRLRVNLGADTDEWASS
jgi:MarR family transcriptional regulator for hemolysin